MATGPKGTQKWGLNKLDDKAAYLDGSEGLYHDWPENYARGLASSESEFVFDEIAKQLRICDCPGAQTVEMKLLAAIQELNNWGTTPKLVLMSLDATQLMNLQRSDKFVPVWHLGRNPWKEMPIFQGMFQLEGSQIPIFLIWTHGDRNLACVLDPSKCLKWTQKSPLDAETELQYLHEFFYFRIADLSKDQSLRLEIERQNPPWLQQYEDRERYLSQRVWLQIYERFVIEVADPRGGCKVTLELR